MNDSEREGKLFVNNDNLGNCLFKIVRYDNNKNVLVEFQDEHKALVHTSYANCLKGSVKNPYYPCVYGVGYMGQGKYNSKNNKKEYKYWTNMLQRAYCDEYKKKNHTYDEVVVCKEFHNFQNFCEWFHSNYYEIEGSKMSIDKDILIKGNKSYEPDKMIFVPARINNLFVKNDKIRGSLPIGVTYREDIERYSARMKIYEDGKQRNIYIGYYNTPEEAFTAYKTYKEQYIKKVADEYKDKIPSKLYEAMYNWTVEIND